MNCESKNIPVTYVTFQNVKNYVLSLYMYVDI